MGPLKWTAVGRCLYLFHDGVPFLEIQRSATRDRKFESISLQRRVSCEPRSRRSAQAASVAIDLSDAKAISLMSVAVLLFSPMVVLALTNRFRLVPRLNEGYHFARQIVALVSVK